jgi:cell division protein FtsL
MKLFGYSGSPVVRLRVYYADINSTYISEDPPIFTSASTWTYLTATHTAPTNAYYAYVALDVYSSGAFTINGAGWKAIKFEQGSTPTTWVNSNYLSGLAAIVNTSATATATTAGNVATLSSTVATQGSSINSNTTAISTANANIANLTTTVNSNTSSIGTINGQITTINGNISSNTSSISTLNSNVSSLTTSVNSNTSSINTINGQITTINGQVSSNSSSISTLNGNVSSLTTTVNSNTSSISSLNASVTTNSTAITNLQGRTTAYLNQVAAVGGASAPVKIMADNVSGSAIQLVADSIVLGNQSSPVLAISGGTAYFYGNLVANSISTGMLQTGSVNTGNVANQAITNIVISTDGAHQPGSTAGSYYSSGATITSTGGTLRIDLSVAASQTTTNVYAWLMLRRFIDGNETAYGNMMYNMQQAGGGGTFSSFTLETLPVGTTATYKVLYYWGDNTNPTWNYETIMITEFKR